MKPTTLIVVSLALLMLPMVAVAAVAGAIIPAATSATTCSITTGADTTNSETTGADTSSTSAGLWRPPLTGRYVFSSSFGMRYHPVLHTTKLHTGIDLVATPNNTSAKTVIAAAAGTVVTRGFNTAYGNQVVLDHGNGTQTRYAHMAAPSPVHDGEKVTAGTHLGSQGATGYVTGAHLHFEVIRNGQPIDPKPFMRQHGAPLNGGPANGGRQAQQVALKPAAEPASTTGSGTQSGSATFERTDGRRVTLDAVQLANANTIARIGRQVGAGDRGVVVALMAALQESTLRNLAYGDRDSLGLFQQRTGWGTAIQRRTPVYAAKAFFGGPDGPNRGRPPGLLDTPGWEQMGPGQAAQAVQVSAFPNAYDAWEPVAKGILEHAGTSAQPTDCAAGASAAATGPAAVHTSTTSSSTSAR